MEDHSFLRPLAYRTTVNKFHIFQRELSVWCIIGLMSLATVDVPFIGRVTWFQVSIVGFSAIGLIRRRPDMS